MFNLGFIATVASLITGGAVATVTVVGLVNSSVNTAPEQSGDVSGRTAIIEYGSR